MPTTPANANAFIEQELDRQIKSLENLLKADAIAFTGQILFGVDDVLRNAVEERRGRRGTRDRLAVVLTTPGGYIEVVQRVADTFRQHYDVVEFVVPNYAFSAGTVLVMSGDEIHMDYYSRLGPIDPQLEQPGGRLVPALGYLMQWDRLIEKAQSGTLTAAELQLMIDGFDQAELYQYEQARELSVALLTDWLAKYKFKNWTVTHTRGRPVTANLRKRRAASIARRLNDIERWHTHVRGISMEVLEKDLDLRINDFGKRPTLNDTIRSYDGLLRDYMGKQGLDAVVHTHGRYNPLAVAV